MEFRGARNRSFNLTKFKAAARRESRKHAWDIPFVSGRAATNEDLESNPIPIKRPTRSSSSPQDNFLRVPSPEVVSVDHGMSGMRRRTPFEKESYTAPQHVRHQPEPTPVLFGFIRHAEPRERYTVANQIRGILGSWAMLLLPCVPAGIILHFKIGDSITTFVVNFMALIPLNSLSDLALDEIRLRVTGIGRGFLYICTGNFVQLVGSIILLRSGNTVLLQTSLIGGLLANLLLILGLSVLGGGIGRLTQHFNRNVAHTSANLLSLAATSLLIPTASKLLGQINPLDIPKQSRGTAFVLLAVYVCYLFYQFRSHKEVFEEPSMKVERQPLRRIPSKESEGIDALIQAGTAVGASTGAPSIKDRDWGESPFAPSQFRRQENLYDKEEDEDYEKATLPGYMALAIFVAASTLLALCVDYTVNSIDALSTGANLSHTFIGLILLPIPNCDIGPIKRATYDKLDEAMNDTIGKCLQTALFVTPLTVLIAWGMGVDEMTMVFDGFEIVSLFAAILLLNLLMERGEVTWIQGCLLLGDWALVAISAFFAKQATSGP